MIRGFSLMDLVASRGYSFVISFSKALALHEWEAVVFSLCLISLMYIGLFILKIVSIRSSWAEHGDVR
ncbi:hypothetical protein HanXRQr2_Chr08g0336581 [Helianthus annuus]|uniref:Uncharacterized protein n=1 Tax=Helianthus annuus TaxID=4232 RepID=A0A251U5S6_HELAN|nr:hypothetical protein HanXRQr2_Chr08g0336581 [Helianthus annuus]KAJ0553345.1 hypothetical protein HanHA89_Chr08g0295361 [Helianthus annuus]